MEYNYNQEAPERCVKAMKKSGKLAVAVMCIALGVILLLFGNRAGKKDGADGVESLPAGGGLRTTEEYRAELEARMESLCSRVAGVGSVEVVVTLEGGFAYVYACDVKTTASGESTTYITVGSGNNESPVSITERAPAILGIGVVCAGGMDPTVRKEFTALLSAAFGVGSNKIYVTGGR